MTLRHVPLHQTSVPSISGQFLKRYELFHLGCERTESAKEILFINWTFFFTEQLNFSFSLFLCFQEFICDPPVLTRRSPLTVVMEGQPASLKCKANGDPEPEVHWISPEGRLISNGSRYTLDDKLRLEINCWFFSAYKWIILREGIFHLEIYGNLSQQIITQGTFFYMRHPQKKIKIFVL